MKKIGGATILTPAKRAVIAVLPNFVVTVFAVEFDTSEGGVEDGNTYNSSLGKNDVILKGKTVEVKEGISVGFEDGRLVGKELCVIVGFVDGGLDGKELGIIVGFVDG